MAEPSSVAEPTSVADAALAPDASAPSPEAPNAGAGLGGDRAFRTLWVVSACHNLGEKLFFVVLVLLADLSAPANTMVSVLSAVFAAPAILFGAAAGVVVDRVPVRTAMVCAGLGRAALVAALPLAGGRVPALLGFALAFSLLTRFHDPAFMKAVPTYVRPTTLMAANAAFTITMIAGLIGGFAIAGPIWWTLGAAGAHLPVVGLMVGAGLAAVVLPTVRPEGPPGPAYHASWREVVAYVLNRPTLRAAYGMMMAVFGTFAAVNVLAKGYVVAAVPGARPADFTLMLAFAGVGMAAGAVAVGRLGGAASKAGIVRVGFVLTGGALVGLALLGAVGPSLQAPPVWGLALLLAFGVGAGGAAIDVPLATLVQEEVDPDVRGRVFGVQGALMNLASMLPMTVAGPLADWLGPAAVMGTLGGAFGLVALGAARLEPRPATS